MFQSNYPPPRTRPLKCTRKHTYTLTHTVPVTYLTHTVIVVEQTIDVQVSAQKKGQEFAHFQIVRNDQAAAFSSRNLYEGAEILILHTGLSKPYSDIPASVSWSVPL